MQTTPYTVLMVQTITWVVFKPKPVTHEIIKLFFPLNYPFV